MTNHGKINYVEFAASDLDATSSFFTKVFQWTFQTYGPDYLAFSDSGLQGGFYRSDLNADYLAGSPLVVLFSDDLEDTLQVIVGAGGTIKKDIFSFPGGRRFHFTEPSGNELAVWSDKGTV